MGALPPTMLADSLRTLSNSVRDYSSDVHSEVLRVAILGRQA